MVIVRSILINTVIQCDGPFLSSRDNSVTFICWSYISNLYRSLFKYILEIMYFSLGIRLVLLIRDPRGILQSRKHREWCPTQPDCSDPALVCADMVSDFSAAVRLIKEYPHTFRYTLCSFAISRIWESQKFAAHKYLLTVA